MNEHVDLERLVADSIASEGVSAPSDAFYDELYSRVGRSGQRPEWLALIKEPPMRTNSHLAVGSPTVRVAAIVAATLLIAVTLAGAGIAGSRLLAADDAIVVDQSGGGDFTTIGDAVEAAEDGDTIRIRPGRYIESVAISGKDLSIVGDGDRDDVVIEAAFTAFPDPVVEPISASVSGLLARPEAYPWAVLLWDTASSLAEVTIVGHREGMAVLVTGAEAAPTLRDVTIRVPEPIDTESYVGHAVGWTTGAGGTLRDSIVEGTLDFGDGTHVVIEDNDMPASCLQVWGESADIVIRGNVIRGCPYELGIGINAASTVVVDGNDIHVEDVTTHPEYWYSAGRIGVEVYGQGPGVVTISDNDIHDSRFGIQVSEGIPTLEITGNRLRDNDMGIARIVGDPAISSNTITGSRQIGLEIRAGAANLEGNVITDNVVGLSIAEGSAPTLTDNTICSNTTNVRLASSTSLDASDNEICEDLASG